MAELCIAGDKKMILIILSVPWTGKFDSETVRLPSRSAQVVGRKGDARMREAHDHICRLTLLTYQVTFHYHHKNAAVENPIKRAYDRRRFHNRRLGSKSPATCTMGRRMRDRHV